MNKKILIVLIILILIGVGVYLFTKKPSQSIKQETVNSQDNTTNTENKTTQGTLKSLLTAGKSQKCTYSKNLESVSLSGTVYISNGKMRGDYVSGTEQMKVNGHMIVDGQYLYSWTDLSKQGTKMAINQEAQTPATASENTSSQASDMNQAFEYVCQGWTEDASVFIVPSDITFSALTLPSANVSPSTGTNTSACAVCDNVPEGQARDTCKTQLNCK